MGIWLLKYLKYTAYIELVFKPTHLKWEFFSDTDHGRTDTLLGRTIMAHNGFLGGCLVVWSSVLHKETAHNKIGSETFGNDKTAKAITDQKTIINDHCATTIDYKCLSNTMKSITDITTTGIGMGITQDGPRPIYSDSEGSVKLTYNLVIARRSRHINIPYMYLRQSIAKRESVLILIGLLFNNADMGTKPLYFTAHKRHRDACGYVLPYETAKYGSS